MDSDADDRTAGSGRGGVASSLARSSKATQTRLVEQVHKTRGRLEEARPRSRTIDGAFLVQARDTESGGGVLAAAVALRVFMFAIPFIFVAVVLFGVAGSLTGEDPRSVARSAGIGGLMAQAVGATAKHLNGPSRVFALIGGLVAVFLAGRAFLKTLRVVHGLVWRVRVHKQARATQAVVVLVVVFTIVLLLSVAVDHARRASAVGGLIVVVLYTAVPFGIWLGIELAMPHARQVGWKDLLPGAILFGVAVLVLDLFTVYWIAHLIKRRSATYGTIGVALALLLWAYVLGRFMTASAVVNASIWDRDHPRSISQSTTRVETAANAAKGIEPEGRSR